MKKDPNKTQILKLKEQVKLLKIKNNYYELELNKKERLLSKQSEQILTLTKERSLYLKTKADKYIEIVSYWLNLALQVIVSCTSIFIINKLSNEQNVNTSLFSFVFLLLFLCIISVMFRDTTINEHVPLHKIIFLIWDGISFYVLSLIINCITYGFTTTIQVINFNLFYLNTIILILSLFILCIITVQISKLPQNKTCQKVVRIISTLISALIIVLMLNHPLMR
ncbi:hypothetical protein SAMN05216351_104140 [Pseudobutyrivibrio sp. JW11]|nr:hypothetical protein SAMN05216351_104140 [Pseudobutyrivibrio sp. JW11]